MPAMKIAGLCLPLKPQKEKINKKYADSTGYYNYKKFDLG